jgi:hypothetical protein
VMSCPNIQSDFSSLPKCFFQPEVALLKMPYQSTSHKLTQVGSVGRTYDAMGNLTSVGGISREYVYNNAGRMSATKQNNAITATYVYNGLGEQVKRTVGATVTVFVYDEGGIMSKCPSLQAHLFSHLTRMAASAIDS